MKTICKLYSNGRTTALISSCSPNEMTFTRNARRDFSCLYCRVYTSWAEFQPGGSRGEEEEERAGLREEALPKFYEEGGM